MWVMRTVKQKTAAAYTIQYGCAPELAIKGSAHVGSSSLVC